MRLFARRGQPVKRWLKKFRRNSQLKLDGSHPIYTYVDPRYYENGEGFPLALSAIETAGLELLSVQELKDLMDLNNIDRTGLTLKQDLIDAIIVYVNSN